MHQQLFEETPLSQSFNKKDIETMIGLLKKNYKIPENGFQAFSGPGEHFETTLVKNKDKRIFRFVRVFPFIIGAINGSAGLKFRKLFLKSLEKMLEKL